MENEATPILYASLGRRILAFVIDALILAIPFALADGAIPYIGWVLVWFLYGPVLESSLIRATLGKHLCGIQVADTIGRRVSFKAALVRNLLKVVSTVILLLGFVFALFSSRKQALHDMLADTIVVYGRSERPITEAWSTNVKDVFDKAAHTMDPGRGEKSLVAELERLQALRANGTLTDEEFQAAKRRILG